MSDDVIPDPDTFEALYLRLRNLEQRSKRHAEEGQNIAKELLDLTTDMFIKRMDSPTRGTVKRESGRLTDEGIRALQAAFANGMRVSEAVAAFGISQSAASARHKEWRASQKAVFSPEPPAALKLEPEPPPAAPVPTVAPEPPAAQVEPEPPPAAPTPEPPLAAAKPKRRPRRATKPTGDG